MTRAALIIATLVLGGCTTPAITAAGGGNVTVRYDSILYTREEITARAAEQCRALDAASTGARFLSSSTEGPLFGFRYDVFACER